MGSWPGRPMMKCASTRNGESSRKGRRWMKPSLCPLFCPARTVSAISTREKLRRRKPASRISCEHLDIRIPRIDAVHRRQRKAAPGKEAQHLRKEPPVEIEHVVLEVYRLDTQCCALPDLPFHGGQLPSPIRNRRFAAETAVEGATSRDAAERRISSCRSYTYPG